MEKEVTHLYKCWREFLTYSDSPLKAVFSIVNVVLFEVQHAELSESQ
jgi:hypothetical protein